MPSATKYLDQHIVDSVNELLDSGDYVPDDIIDEWTIKYSDGTEVDVKLCGGGDPYLDVVWFQNNCEVAVCEPSYQIDGSYYATIDGEEYVLYVKGE